MNSSAANYALIIPALNEAEPLGELLRLIPRAIFTQVIVVDNGSEDSTAEIARAAGAIVVREPRRGYGQACSRGLAVLRPEVSAVAFMDADLSDDPEDLERLCRAFEEGEFDLVLGSRVLGGAEPGALTPLQRFGNWLTTRLIHSIWHVSFTDLGPLRMVSRDALNRLNLRDRDFGWNAEMQAKAARLGLKVKEIPVRYRKRRSGRSKVSGTLKGSFLAGVKILWIIFRCWLMPSKAGFRR